MTIRALNYLEQLIDDSYDWDLSLSRADALDKRVGGGEWKTPFTMKS